ncbi:phosphotransferase [Aliarcobacter butzleri]|nr:phosphotransferase [Aliarcobacter butzleri]
MIVLERLNGYSGCEVYLLEGFGKTFVRKFCKQEYAQRLKIQAEKQIQFKSLYVKTPKIFSYNSCIEDKYFIEMEFVNGLHFNDYILRKDLFQIKKIVENLIDDILKREELDNIDTNSVKIKLDSLKKFCDSSEKKKSLKYLYDFDWNLIKNSYCHGDLTFENILVKNDEIYLIDFLDSFIDTKYIDIAKILQDIDVYWSLRNKEIDSNLLIRYQIIKKLLLDKLNKEEKKICYTLLLINLLRILPYVSDEKTNNFLQKKIEYVNYILEENIYE